MHMSKVARFVLVLDHDRAAARSSAARLAGEDRHALIARTPAAALEFARQYRPVSRRTGPKLRAFRRQVSPRIASRIQP